MTETHEERPLCPKCKGDNVASIIWGMPVFSEELMRDLDEGRVHIGGCCITGEDSAWHCNDCGHEWGNYDFSEWWD